MGRRGIVIFFLFFFLRFMVIGGVNVINGYMCVCFFFLPFYNSFIIYIAFFFKIKNKLVLSERHQIAEKFRKRL